MEENNSKGSHNNVWREVKAAESMAWLSELPQIFSAAPIFSNSSEIPSFSCMMVDRDDILIVCAPHETLQAHRGHGSWMAGVIRNVNSV